MALSEDELKQVHEFWHSAAAKALFEEMEHGLTEDWMMTTDLATRERLWADVQALRRLQAGLRDATAMKRLTQRAQERGVFNA